MTHELNDRNELRGLAEQVLSFCSFVSCGWGAV